jgi:hypothetical protein
MKRDMLQMKAGWLVERCGFLRRSLAFALMPALAALSSCSPAMATDCDAFNISAHPSMKADTPEQIISFELIRDLQLVFNGPFAAPEGAACDIDLKLSIDDGGNTTIELKSQSDDGGPEIEEVLRYSEFHQTRAAGEVIAALLQYSKRLEAFRSEGSEPNAFLLEALCDWAKDPVVMERRAFLSRLDKAALDGIVFGHPYDSSDIACSSIACGYLSKSNGTVYVRYLREATVARILVGLDGPRSLDYWRLKFGGVEAGTFRVERRPYARSTRKHLVYDAAGENASNLLDQSGLRLSDPFPKIHLVELKLSGEGVEPAVIRFVRPEGRTGLADLFKRTEQCEGVSYDFGGMLGEIRREQSE